MKTRNKILTAAGLALVVGLLYVGWIAYGAHSNLVTLNVRNMDVRQVVKKIEWQTWENIFVHKDVQGKVTLAVHQAPLEKVLKIIADQTASRSSVIYPLYSSGQSYVTLKKALRGEINAAENGWTNLQSRASFRGGPGGPGGMFGAQTENPKQRVSFQFQGKDVPFVTLAFDRFAQTRVVPEDGTDATISLTLKQATVPDAVAQLAKKTHRNWAKLYVLRGGFGGFAGGGPAFGGGGPGGGPGRSEARGTNGPAQFAPWGGGTNQAGFGRRELTEEQRAEMNKQREDMRKQREDLEAALKQTLPVEERQKLEQAEADREKLMKEMQAMTPEQRMQKFSQMAGVGGASMDLRNRERLLNSTPEQRARAGGPGGGGPGRGGPGGSGRGGPGRGGPGGPPQ